MKIYCKNCRHYEGYHDVVCVSTCSHVTINEFTGERNEFDVKHHKPYELNSTGTCKYYKRVWFKFWVKE